MSKLLTGINFTESRFLILPEKNKGLGPKVISQGDLCVFSQKQIVAHGIVINL